MDVSIVCRWNSLKYKFYIIPTYITIDGEKQAQPKKFDVTYEEVEVSKGDDRQYQ